MVDFSIEQIKDTNSNTTRMFGKNYITTETKGERLCAKNLKDYIVKEPWSYNFEEKYHEWDQDKFLGKLQLVLGMKVDGTVTPNPDYMLTEDSTLKILAVLTRFNVGLPTIVMGSTGCGKTSMVHYIAQLLNYGRRMDDIQGDTFFDIRCDGGTTEEEITETVLQAMRRAEELQASAAANFVVVGGVRQPPAILLFIDECNACNCMGLIEDIICKGKLGSEDLNGLPLRIVSACNPFQKMSEEAIGRLESAGLGSYSNNRNDSKTSIAGTPMRHLVYRVNPVPRSMSQYLFDFGQLSLGVERSYIRKIVERSTADMDPPMPPERVSDLTDLLFQSQKHMRSLPDEFSFVSLRDVKRAIKIFSFFYGLDQLIREEDARLKKVVRADSGSAEGGRVGAGSLVDDQSHGSMIVAISLAYRSRLTDRRSYEELVALVLDMEAGAVNAHIERIQEIFAKNLNIGKRIALNAALTENAFTLIVCMQLGIPLTLVGKPGSSKSLAKTVVEDTLRGKESVVL
eukprot:gene27386-24040_t